MIGVKQTAISKMTAQMHPSADIDDCIQLFSSSVKDFKLISINIKLGENNDQYLFDFEIEFYHTLEIKK